MPWTFRIVYHSLLHHAMFEGDGMHPCPWVDGDRHPHLLPNMDFHLPAQNNTAFAGQLSRNWEIGGLFKVRDTKHAYQEADGPRTDSNRAYGCLLTTKGMYGCPFSAATVCHQLKEGRLTH